MIIYKTKNDVWCYVVIYYELTAIFLFGDVFPEGSAPIKWCLWIYNLLSRNAVFNTVNSILCYIMLLYALCKYHTIKIFRLGRFFVWLTSSILIAVSLTKHQNGTLYLTLVFSFALNLLMAEICKYINADKVPQIKSSFDGFLPDNCNANKHQDIGWKKYAECLLKRLDNTDLQGDSFAVALVGKWGTGKTTFLGYMKEIMHRNQMNYIEFNPWLSNAADNIVQDFFNLLKCRLREQGINLDDEINKYVKMLINCSNESFALKMGELLNLDEHNDLGELRGRLSQNLEYLGKKLYVIIDDLDRLRGEEIFEVLKLIRNTADFNDIIYIVPYDKEYLSMSLKSLGIAKQEEYLKKIFQMELDFPLYENYLISNLFYNELKSHTKWYPMEIKIRILELERILKEEKINLVSYINNFRDAKRLVNELVLIFDYVIAQNVIKDFNVRDLFLVQLLEFSDKEVYHILQKNMLSILEPDNSNPQYLQFKLKDVDKREYCFNPQTTQLLKIMFPHIEWNKPKQRKNSIQRKDRIYTYFSLRPFAYQMSLTEFENLLRNVDTETIMKYIADSNIGVFSKATSIYHMLNEQSLSGLDTQAIENFMVLLTEWTKKYEEYDLDKIGTLYRNVFGASNIDVCSIDFVRNSLLIFYDEIRRQERGLYIVQKICCKMMPCLADFDDDGNAVIYPECIFGEDELLDILETNTKAFLEKENPKVASLLSLNSNLHIFLKCSAVCNESYLKPQFDRFPVANAFISYFRNSRAHNNVDIFLNRFVLQKYESINGDDGYREMENDIMKYFTCVSFYVEFVQECFNDSYRQKIKNYLIANRLAK